jgi:Zn-dependent M32 family carboxypeptidase
MGMGIHESQSLLWERMVGLSRPFAAYLLPLMCEFFPQVRLGRIRLARCTISGCLLVGRHG